MSLKAEITTNIMKKVHIAMGDYANLQYKIVDELPKKGETGIVYLVPPEDPAHGELFEQYIWIDNTWKKIGNINLNDYYTKEEVDALLKEIEIEAATEEKIGGILSSNLDKSEDGKRKYISVDAITGIASVSVDRIIDSPTAQEDIIEVLNKDSETSAVVLDGGKA